MRAACGTYRCHWRVARCYMDVYISLNHMKRKMLFHGDAFI